VKTPLMAEIFRLTDLSLQPPTSTLELSPLNRVLFFQRFKNTKLNLESLVSFKKKLNLTLMLLGSQQRHYYRK